MDRDDLIRLSPTEPATVIIGDDRHHFGALRDAVEFALHRVPEALRDAAWVIVDRGLIAPEELPPVAHRLAS
jgi:hypothetical protein